MDPAQDPIEQLYDAEVTSVDGDDLGPVRQVYVDEGTGRPAWVVVRTGWFGGREHPVPLEGWEPTEDGIRVSAAGTEVRDAPTVEEGGDLDESDVAALHAHYGLDGPAAPLRPYPRAATS